MDFLYQFIELFIISKADEASGKGDRKQTAGWLLTFAAIIVLTVGILWLRDSLRSLF